MGLRHIAYPLLVACVGTLGLASFFFATLARDGADTWEGMSLYPLAHIAEYCEHNDWHAPVRQTMNSWSSLCYAFLGSFMVAWVVQDRVPGGPMRRFPWLWAWMGLALVGLGCGSFLFHASLTRWGQQLDMGFTYAVAITLMGAGGYRLALLLGCPEGPRARRVALGLTVLASVALYVFKWEINGKWALPALMLAGLGLMLALFLLRRRSYNGWLLLGGVACLVLSGVFRQLDVAKVGCDPQGPLQLHALWHVCTGLSATLCWAFLWWEKGE
jgi:hypothetical protein